MRAISRPFTLIRSFPALKIDDVSGFPVLEELGLSAYNMDRFTDGQELLAPRLRNFCWSFTLEGQDSEAWTAFAQGEEDWLRQFSALAISRKSTLQQIKVDFSPDPDRLFRTEGLELAPEADQMIFPWDRIDAIRDQILRPANIKLPSTPPITKEEFQKIRTMAYMDFYQERVQYHSSDSQNEGDSKNESDDEDAGDSDSQRYHSD